MREPSASRKTVLTETEKIFLRTIFLKGVPLVLLTGLGFLFVRKTVLIVTGYEIPASFLAASVAVVVGVFSDKHIKPYIRHRNRGQ